MVEFAAGANDWLGVVLAVLEFYRIEWVEAFVEASYICCDGKDVSFGWTLAREAPIRAEFVRVVYGSVFCVGLIVCNDGVACEGERAGEGVAVFYGVWLRAFQNGESLSRGRVSLLFECG